MKRATRLAVLSFLLLVIAFGVLAAQEPAASSSSSSASANQAQAPSAQQPSHNPDTVTGEELDAAAEGDVGEKEENAQLKYSKNVVRWGHFVGLSPRASYTVYWFLNFVLLVLFFAYFLRKLGVSNMFRNRTAAIQKGIREAQAASAEATRRLSDIEARLAKLDTEVAEIRASAESEAAAEEARILAGRRGRQAQNIGVGGDRGHRHRAQCPPRIEELRRHAGG